MSKLNLLLLYYVLKICFYILVIIHSINVCRKLTLPVFSWRKILTQSIKKKILIVLANNMEVKFWTDLKNLSASTMFYWKDWSPDKREWSINYISDAFQWEFPNKSSNIIIVKLIVYLLLFDNRVTLMMDKKLIQYTKPSNDTNEILISL